ncbi:MAG: DUF1851 domain-containing protein [Rhodocyclales bacterium GT-UBC]|nr:MAG: DUF1851 domain-containing protein [Rhodocyclales bacterium GT-UBC]
MQTQPEEMMMANYRFDEDFDYFLEKFGEPHDSVPIPESVIDAYRDKLPEQLFVYWRALGACGFHNGLLWMVNPAEYQDLLDMWLDGTPFESRTDLSVIARTAFGRLYVWGKGKAKVLSIDPNVNATFYNSENDALQLEADKEAFKMRCFWGFHDPEDLDDTDESEKPLFARALKKLGQIKSDEMYGYQHRLALGGKEELNNLDIVKLEVYHNIAQQMEPPQIITTS